MVILYIIIAAIAGIASILCCRYFTHNDSIINITAIISVLTTIALTKIFIAPIYTYEKFEITLEKNNPEYTLIKKKYPAEFNNYITNTKKSILEMNDSNEMIFYNITFINSVFIKCIPTATNQSIYNFYQVELILDKALFQIDPELVLFMEFSNKFLNKPSPYMINALVGQKLIETAATAKELVIYSSIKNPQPQLTEEQRKNSLKMLSIIMHDLVKKYGETTLNTLANFNPDDPLLNKKLLALVIMSFYEEILNTGQENAAMIFKLIAESPQRH